MPAKYTLVQIGNSPNWFIQWFEAGHSRRRSTGTADRGEATEILAGFILRQATRRADRLPLSEVLDWYLRERGPEIADPARARYAIAHLKAFYGDLMADEVSLDNQGLYVDHRRATGVATSTIQRELAVLSAALKKAVAHEKLDRASAIKPLPATPARDRYLTRDEAALLLRRLRRKPRAYHLILFTRLALYTGARTAAILDLTWDRVDLKKGLIKYPVPGRRKTSKTAAVVPIGPNLIRALAHARRKTNSTHVVSFRGERCTRIARGFTRRAAAAGLKNVTPHTLRHTYASWAAMKGVPLWLIGQAIGQKTVSVTERYAKHQPEALKAVMDAVRRK